MGVPGLTRVLGTLGVLLGAGNVQRVGLPHVETWEHSTAEMTVDEFNSQFLILICILEIAMQIPIRKAMQEAGAGICRAPLRQGRVLSAGKDLPQCPCADHIKHKPCGASRLFRYLPVKCTWLISNKHTPLPGTVWGSCGWPSPAAGSAAPELPEPSLPPSLLFRAWQPTNNCW